LSGKRALKLLVSNVFRGPKRVPYLASCGWISYPSHRFRQWKQHLSAVRRAQCQRRKSLRL